MTRNRGVESKRRRRRRRRQRRRERAAEELPPDLWSCILMRLNPKQVMRWGCVSKYCRQVVDQVLLKDDFYLNQVVRASSPGIVFCSGTSRLFYHSKHGIGVDISYPWTDDDEPGRRARLMTVKGIDDVMRVAPSINGLICVTDFLTIRLCNPTTGESLTIPMCPVSPGSYDLDCDDEFGFGYSPSTGEYKFVHLSLSSYVPGLSECRVLTLSLNSPPPRDDQQHQQQQRTCSTTTDIDDSPSWRRIQHSIGYDAGAEGFNSASVYLEGVIYWSGHTGSPDNDNGPPNPGDRIDFIVSFHVRDEIFTTIPPPPPPGHPYHIHGLQLTELQGRLGVARLMKQDDCRNLGYELDVWLQMSPGIWARRLRIDYLNKELGCDYFNFSFLSGGKFIISGDRISWYIYDFKSKSLVRRVHSSEFTLPCPIKESFLSLRFVKGVNRRCVA